MDLLGTPKTEYMLEAGLEVLHAESREWLSEITFWNGVMTFFYRLLHMREPHFSFPTAGLALLEKQLIQITSDRLMKFKAYVQNHERDLGRIVRSRSFDGDREYRDAHRSIRLEKIELQRIISDFKKKVFAFI